jgi:hypothetical protein
MCRLCHVVPKMGDLIHIYEGKAFSGFTPVEQLIYINPAVSEVAYTITRIHIDGVNDTSTSQMCHW